MDSSLVSGYCTYCGYKMINDNAVVGRVSINRAEELVNSLKMVRTAIEDGDRSTAEDFVQNALSIDPECADAWYMRAALDSGNKKQSKLDRERGNKGKPYGVFSKSDLDALSKNDLRMISGRSYSNEPSSEEKSDTKYGLVFLILAFYVGFFGLTGGGVYWLSEGSSKYFFGVIGVLILIGIAYILYRLWLRKTARARDCPNPVRHNPRTM